jgi:hypothetical protein
METEFEAGTTGSSFGGARCESADTDGNRLLLSTGVVGSTTTVERGAA